MLYFVDRPSCEWWLQKEYPRVGATRGRDFLADWPTAFQLSHQVCGGSAVVAHWSHSELIGKQWPNESDLGTVDVDLSACVDYLLDVIAPRPQSHPTDPK